MKTLVIVESPTKARTIGRFLGKEYEIKASMGHIMDLPKSTLAIDMEHDFAPQYEMVSDKKKIVSELKSVAKTAGSILLATDPDREGEAIASHVKDVLLQGKKSKSKSQKFQRIVFHEITKEAIEEALKNPRSIDTHLVDAQTARRVLDRIVGYKLSPVLWQKIRRGLSAGRVQSVALRLIVEREKEIEKFTKEPYWTISAQLQKEKGRQKEERNEASLSNTTQFELIEINGQKIELQETFDLYDGQYKVTKTTIDAEASATQIAAVLWPQTFTVADVAKKESRRSPQPPYTTSTLQQDASRRLGYSGKRTMTIAQKLYEEGYITYHRTDSVAMASSAVFAIREHVQHLYGEKYIPQKPRFYTTRQKLAQEAHECIRPTKVKNSESVIQQDLGRDFAKLYSLIWKRAVASQMSDAITQSTTVLVDTVALIRQAEKDLNDSSAASQNDKTSYRLKATGSVLLFDGFLKVNPMGLNDTILAEFRVGEKLAAKEVTEVPHETTPPPRYNDASLIKTLEEKGIGRPSTYATIVSTIEARQYIEREEGRFLPTPVGAAVTQFLVQHFSTIDDIPFTAEMEESLDLIANGQKEWGSVMQAFYTPFEKSLNSVKDAARVKIETETVDEQCPKCGNSLVVRVGRFGKFLSCSTFPTCDFRKSYMEKTSFTCPKDGGQVIVKKTRKGKNFYGCSNYPKCDFAVWKLEDIKTYGAIKTTKTIARGRRRK